MPRIRLFAVTLMGIAGFALVSPTQAQQPDTSVESAGDLVGELPSDGTVTPEMWFYQQEYRRYQSPAEAVRRNAEFRATQRRNRLAAQRWFGFSNLRPVANPIPFYGSYSPAWGSNTWNPAQWAGAGSPYVVYHTARRSE